MKIVPIDGYFKQAKMFLSGVQTIDEIDEEVLKNAVVAIDDEEVVGLISFEKFNTYGLIRYFIFKKGIDLEMIEKLFLALIKKALDSGILNLFSIIVSKEVKSMFENFQFYEINKDHFFIDEDSISNTRYRDAIVMARRISA